MFRAERGLIRVLAFVVLRRSLHTSGRDNVPASGPVLLVSNHVATCDPALGGAFIKRLDVYFMAKSESFHTRWNRFWLRGFNAFPVVRQTADRGALRYALEVLADGHALFMYPEGSRSPDHRIARPYPGVGFIARRSGVPIVPVAVWGSEGVLSKGRLLPRHAEVHLVYGEPFQLPERNPDGSEMSHQQSTDYMMSRVADMLPPEYRGVYGADGNVMVDTSPAA